LLPALLRAALAVGVLSLGELSAGKRPVSDVVADVAQNPSKLVISDPVDFGLIIYDFDAAQRDAFGTHLKRLTDCLGENRVKFRGSARGLQI